MTGDDREGEGGSNDEGGDDADSGGDGDNDGILAGDEDRYACDDCGTAFTDSEATRRATMGDLDTDTWQTLCCPTCGARVKTVFVGDR